MGDIRPRKELEKIMDVILLERIEKLGQMGDVVTVKPGFARNFLLPQKKALRASAQNREYFNERKAQLEAENLEKSADAQKVADKMEGLSISIIRSAGDSGQLYGSVNSRDIAEGVTEAGFTVTRNQVLMDRPIKMLGLHDYRVRLHPEVETSVIVNIAQSEDEAVAQLASGKAIIPSQSIDDDEDVAQFASRFGEEDDDDAMGASAEAAPEATSDAEEEQTDSAT
ncbi:MAG: large subunit ribosomal protein L9 [Alphaproteobacteria bacterium]|jgi:large subunit ribosomal protein L9